MSEHAMTSTTSHSGAGHAEVEPFLGLDPNVLGIIVFITSEAIFFASLIVTYIVYHNANPHGPNASTVLDVPYTAVFTVFLLSSSFTMSRVHAHLGRNEVNGVRAWLLATIVLGLLFILGQGYEYVHLYIDNVTIARNLWASSFFILTGFHGLHVIIGLLSMSIIAGLIKPGEPHMRAGRAVETISYYWHFVDAVWVVIFPTVYLWPLLVR